jgi:hypothetical protein
MSPTNMTTLHRHTQTSFVLIIAVLLTSFTVEAGDDFDGFMQQQHLEEAEATDYRQRLADHDEWLHTTWGGWAVRTMRGIAEKMRPFIEAVIEATQDEDTGTTLSPMRLLVYVGLRLYVVVMGLLLIYALSRLVQMVVGNGDIVVEEEVVIVHEHDTEEEAAKARAAQARGKKQKSQ